MRTVVPVQPRLLQRRMALLMVSFAIALSICSGLAFAEVREDKSATWITGQLKPDDYEELTKAAQRAPADRRWHINLNSPGGDIATALRMGRLLRRHQASVNVGANAVCLSACVFLLAGGVERRVQSHLGAVVGIHRPYDPTDNAVTLEAQREKQQRWAKEIQAYLQHVNVGPELYSQMLRTAPDEIRKLSRSELHNLGLGNNDPYWDDAQGTVRAKTLGLSKGEYVARKSRASAICPGLARPGKLFDDLICEANVLRGLPPGQGLD